MDIYYMLQHQGELAIAYRQQQQKKKLEKNRAEKQRVKDNKKK